MAEFRMPILGADMTEGTLVAWHKKPGDHVTRGEIIAEVETEKAAIDVEAFTSGVIERLLVEPGATVPVGSPMAIIREDGEEAGVETSRTAAPSPQPSAPETPPPSQASPVSREAPPAPEGPRLRISPSAKQLASELGVDPSTVHGTGPGGAITRQDIERADRRAKAPQAVKADVAGVQPAERQARMRQVIAAAMARSKREIPHYYLSTTIDLGHAMAWLAAANERLPVTDRLLYGVLLIKAVALALRDFPELNAVWRGDRVDQRADIHVGVAISLRQGGLVAPALHHADRQSLDELMRNFRDLVKRARAWSLRSSELSEPTITVTSLGEQGVETVYGVIYPPQVALVGFGKVVERPWVVEGRIAPRPLVTATLSGDHRVSDGHRGGRFLAAVERILQEPERL